MNSEDSPFFLTPGSASQHCWYRRTPMGINKLYGIMNDMKEKSGLIDPRITPYRYSAFWSPEEKKTYLAMHSFV